MGQTLPRFEIEPLSEEDGGGYLIRFPDYPGCIADGETPEEAMSEGRDALKSYVETLKELGRPVPAAGEEAFSGKWSQRAPRSLHAALARRAADEGVSFNTLVVSLLSEALGRRESKPQLGEALWAKMDTALIVDPDRTEDIKNLTWESLGNISEKAERYFGAFLPAERPEDSGLKMVQPHVMFVVRGIRTFEKTDEADEGNEQRKQTFPPHTTSHGRRT